MEQFRTRNAMTTGRNIRHALCFGAALKIAGIALAALPITACSVSIEPHPALSSLKLPLTKTVAAIPRRVAAPTPPASTRKPAPPPEAVASTSPCIGAGCRQTIEPLPIQWRGGEGDSGGGWDG